MIYHTFFRVVMMIVGVLGMYCAAQDIREEMLAQKLKDIGVVIEAESEEDQLDKTISIHFENEDLVDVINKIAGEKGVNTILPQTEATAIKSKVTLHIEKKLNIEEAWKLLILILDDAGYTITPKGSMYEIIKNTANITREPLPLYIGVHPDRLPDTDQRIRYIYYLSNIKPGEDPNSEIHQILNALLPQQTTSFKIDPTANALIITAKANDIIAVMKIIRELDKIDFQESLEVLKLRYATAGTVATLFNENIIKAANMDKYRVDARPQNESQFFAKHIRIFPEDRTNSLIILGKAQAIQRIKDFIRKYIDVELESGKSILHVYQLQYLNAEQMAVTLKNIIDAARTGGTDQARVSGLLGGVQQTFEEVYISADKPTNQEVKYSGGNRLVIAARNKDWRVIERLLQELDTPQPQVLIEVLIADMTIEDFRILGSQTRNPAQLCMPGNSAFQSAQLSRVIYDPPAGPPQTIQADLLNLSFPACASQSTTPAVSVAQPLTQAILPNCPTGDPGSTLISLNDADGKTWSLIQLLQQFESTKIISHPHVIAVNNQKASVDFTQIRLLPDQAVSSGGTTTTIQNKNIPAILQVEMTPLISSANTVHLNIKVLINSFTSPVATGNNTRTSRVVETVALVKDTSVLALGGLVQSTLLVGQNQTPILGNIPILGWFFKARNNSATKNTLMVFIKPTIIQPRLRGGVSDYTKSYINMTKNYIYEDGLFTGLRDPITRWFFTDDADAIEITENFLAKDEYKRDLLKKTTDVENKVLTRANTTNERRKRRNNVGAVKKDVKKTREEQAKELQKIIATEQKDEGVTV